MRSLKALGNGLLWAIAVGIVAFYYGYFGVASGFLGLWTLGVLAGASIGILVLFSGYPKVIAFVNYEMCLLAVWFGHLNGTMALGGGCDIQWFCISFLWPWLGFAVVGGLIVLASSGNTDLPKTRIARVAAIVLLIAAGLVAGGFAYLRLSSEQPVAMFRAVPFFLQGIAFSPDGKTVATVGGISGWDKDVRLWDAATGRRLGKCDKERANNGMEKAAVQCFGNPPLVAAMSYYCDFPGSDDKIVIQIWDLATQKQQKRLLWDDTIRVHNSVFSHDGRWFVYSNGNLRAYDLQTERIVVDIKCPKDADVCCLAISPQRDRIACATYNKELEIWDIADSRLLETRHTSEQVSCMDFSPDRRFLVYGTDGGEIEQIQIGEEKIVHSLSCFCGRNGVSAILFSPDGKFLACADHYEGQTKVLDLQSWQVVAELKTWGGWSTECLAFSADGRLLATGDANGRVGIWDTTKWMKR